MQGMTKTSYVVGTSSPETIGTRTLSNNVNPKLYGYTTNDLQDEYAVEVSSTMLGVLVRASMQENLSFSTESTWESVTPDIGNSRMGEYLGLAVQTASALAKYPISLQNKHTSRRCWKGTTPIKMDVKLHFVATDNALNEVFLPCILLQKMALPSVRLLGFLAPPGPSPMILPEEITGMIAAATDYTRDKLGMKKGGNVADIANERLREGSDTITIKFGKLFTFKSVILKRCSIALDKKLSVSGYPISGSAQIEFESYEVMGKEDLDEAMVTGAKEAGEGK